jgi:GT2 family glycosyltransferase
MIDVVVVNYNTREDLRACLRSFCGTDIGETVVVDNASSDGSTEAVRAEFPSVHVIANPTNVGYGAAANQGIERTSSARVLLLNSDTRLVGGSLSAMNSYMEDHPRAGVVGPRLLNDDGSLQQSCFPFPRPFDLYVREWIENWILDRAPPLRARSLRRWDHAAPRIVPYVLGAALAIERRAFEQVGGFHQSFFMYFEEVDFCYRLSQAGWQVHFCPSLTLTHLGGRSTSQRWTEMQTRWYESSVQFYRSNYPRHRLVELLLVMRTGLVARLVRDSVLRSRARDPLARTQLSERIEIWKRALAVR